MKPKVFFFIWIALSVASLFIITSCQETPPGPPPPEKPTGINFEMHGFFNDQKLELAGPYYVTDNGDSIQPVTLIYHINHFRLHKSTGDTVELKNTWHMMDFSNPSSTRISFRDIPDGNYSGISFTIGVEDSLTNADGLISNLFTVPMYWSMNAGYINFKFEGNSPQAPNKTTVLHVGGYTGDFKLARTIRVFFPSGFTIEKEQIKDLRIKMDMAKYFSTPNTIDLSVYHLIHEPNAQARDIADNWPAMFSVMD